MYDIHQTKATHAQCVHGCSVFPSVKAAGLSRSFTRGTVSAHSETPTGLVSLKDNPRLGVIFDTISVKVR